MSTQTGADGSYTLRLAPGHYLVTVEHPDYETATAEADITHGQTTQLDIKLKRKKGALAGVVSDEETTQPIEVATVTATKT